MTNVTRRKHAVDRRRVWVHEQVAKILGNEIICARCRATFASFDETCMADLNEPCQGFRRIDAVQKPLEKKAGLA